MLKNKNKAQKAFTLIELLVVIAIIGLLSSVVLVALNNARSRSRDAYRKASLKQVQAALELYYSDNGAYPSTGGSGSWLGEPSTYGGRGYTGATGYIPNLAPTYIGALPSDPLKGKSNFNVNAGCTSDVLGFLYTSNGTDYKLIAHCGPETAVTATDTFYDPAIRPYAFAVYSTGARTW